jgi:hypothetical protein
VHPKAPKAFPAVSGVFPSAIYAVLCGVRGRDNKRVPSSRYPQRYCSGVSIKGMEDQEKMEYVDKATYISPRTRANYLMSPYAYSALGS